MAARKHRFAGNVRHPGAGDPLDVLSLSGVSSVIRLDGINDFSDKGKATVEEVQSGMNDVVDRVRARLPGVRVVGATVVSAFGSANDSVVHPRTLIE